MIGFEPTLDIIATPITAPEFVAQTGYIRL